MQIETILVLGGLLVVYAIYAYIIYPAFISPLARIPAAHWSCCITNFFILRARKHGAENKTLLAAHARYGSVVRVGPCTLSVDGVDALRAVYQGGFAKDGWYSNFCQYGVPNMFSTLGSKEHSRRKRLISHVYSKSCILSSSAARAQRDEILNRRLLPLLTEEAGKVLEIQSIFMATTMDLISAYIFGLAASTNFIQDKEYRDRWLRLYLSRHNNHFWPQELPVLTKACAKLGIRLYPRSVDVANDEIREWNKRMCEGARDAQPDAAVFAALQAGLEKQGLDRQDEIVASEVLDQLLAGHETSGIVLTYIAWHLSQAPEWQKKLRDEFASASTDPRTLDTLPVLNAVVTETLRLHAPIPGPQPRKTPPQGCHIAGYSIPGGVRIAALAYTLHRDESVFPDAQTWRPERWMGEAKEMNRRFGAFGSGGRMCIGSNFALAGIKNVVATVYANFTTDIVKDDGMEQTDGYSSRPEGDALYVRMVPVG